MRLANRAARLAAQISLLLALLATSGYLVVRTYLGDEETVYEAGNVLEIARDGGPVTIDNVKWKLNSLQPYTRIADKDGEEIGMGVIPGSVLIVAIVTVTPLEGLYLKDNGFSCSASLRDDRGNVWKPAMNTSDWKLPTYCSDDEFPMKLNTPRQIAQMYVVPKSAVPHLVGITVEDSASYRRVLITP
jgi:hypothetical protein